MPSDDSRPRGRYIVLEGGEGVGKSTQVRRIVARLATVGIDAQPIREPGGDPFAEAGRSLLLGDLDREPEAEVLLFNALRVQVLRTRVLPALAQGTWVIADRSRLSTIAYQGHGHGLDLGWTRAVCDTVTTVCPPDLEIILHVDEATSAQRRADRGTTDRFELLDHGFHRRVVAGYLVEAEQFAIPVIDASGREVEVEHAIWDVLEPLLPARPVLH
jgi:dTMP kinase